MMTFNCSMDNSSHSLSGGSNHSNSYHSQGNNNNNNINNKPQNRRRSLQKQDSDSMSDNSDHSMSLSDHSSSSASSLASSNKFVHSYRKPAMPARSQYLALDCEMVGTLTGKSVCARVVVVDWKGRAVMDEYVKPSEPVTDYRTFVSGITAEHLEGAPDLATVRAKVAQLIRGKILVGHGLTNDLECLGMTHPWYMVRDTAEYEPFMKMHMNMLRPRKLKDLAKERLQRDVQVYDQAHSPAEDAITALDLYKSHRPRWEACMTNKLKENQRALVRQQQLLAMQQHQEQMRMHQQYMQQQRQPYNCFVGVSPVLAYP